jgi:23S rRNA pseudouridine2605 synthase
MSPKRPSREMRNPNWKAEQRMREKRFKRPISKAGKKARPPQRAQTIESKPPAHPAPRRTTGQAQRVNRILSAAGLTSRRKADEWIRLGRVRVNGVTVLEPGTQAVWGKDRIEVDGREVQPPAEGLYIILNKPFAYMSTLKDPEGRPVVTDLLKDVGHRVFPVGRLDFDTMGLLLLTNDGDLAYRLTHPRYGVPRTYKVTVEGSVTEQTLSQLQTGIVLDDGTRVNAKVDMIGSPRGRTLLRMTIRQGKSRQIRRMLETVGHPVVHLVRIGFGVIQLGDLKVGRHRTLTPEELQDLKQSVRLN